MYGSRTVATRFLDKNVLVPSSYPPFSKSLVNSPIN